MLDWIGLNWTYINELGQLFRVSSCRYSNYIHIFAPIALGLSPFGRPGLVLGASDDSTRETFSEDGIVIIRGH